MTRVHLTHWAILRLSRTDHWLAWSPEPEN